MDALLDSSALTITCENCNTPNATDVKFCPSCSFPLAGSDDEKLQFRRNIDIRKRLLAEAQKEMKSAKTIIYVLAGIVFLQALYQGFGQDDFLTMIVNLFICVLYLIMAAWANKNPFGAILTAFIVYITLNVVNAFFEPASIFSGIILKIVFVGAFIKGIRSAQEANKFMAELETLKAAPVGRE